MRKTSVKIQGLAGPELLDSLALKVQVNAEE